LYACIPWVATSGRGAAQEALAVACSLVGSNPYDWTSHPDVLKSRMELLDIQCACGHVHSGGDEDGGCGTCDCLEWRAALGSEAARPSCERCAEWERRAQCINDLPPVVFAADDKERELLAKGVVVRILSGSEAARPEETIEGGLIHQPMRREMGVDAPDFGPMLGAAADGTGEPE